METDPFFQCVVSGREKVFITFLEVSKMSKACFLALDLNLLAKLEFCLVNLTADLSFCLKAKECGRVR